MHSDKNRVITILLVSAVMLWALGCAALLNLPAIALFTSRFTARGFVSDADGIVKMYALNTNVTATEIALLRLESLATGMCYPVQYDGYLQWSEEQVSPLCHCLAGKHHEYELNVTRTVGGGVPRTEAELQVRRPARTVL